jgi:acetyl-CoA carboxylase carboxyltransferase component
MIPDLNAIKAQLLQGNAALIQREHDRGKMTARERIAALVDCPDSFYELGLFAGYGMYESEGGCPAAGTILGIGRVEGRLCVIVANDATVKAGAWFPITAKKNLRAQELAMENHIPIVYLVDSAGVFLPMQDEIFPDKDDFGRIFRNNAIMSAQGIPQIAAIMGSCVAGGAYLPIMSDEALIVEGTGSVFLAGPYLVKAAIGEETDIETLGGATTHSEISGVTDYKMPDDATCLKTVRQLISQLGETPKAGFNRTETIAASKDKHELESVTAKIGKVPYNSLDIIHSIIDADSWLPYKDGYGKTILCGYARIEGWSVGIVANQRAVVRSKKGEMQVGGVIYSDSADKAARFIMNCNQKRIPLVFLQDVTGFMVGTRSEQGGIIKDGAKMVNAVANSVVPKFTVVVGNSFGAGNYAMCGRAYDPRLMLAWETAKIAVMGGKQAAQTMLQIQVAKLKKSGNVLSDEDQQAMLQKIENEYESKTNALYAASQLWIDEIIEPHQTRKWLSIGIEMANHNAEIPPFKLGVIQT